jgi:hypothetical protein
MKVVTQPLGLFDALSQEEKAIDIKNDTGIRRYLINFTVIVK